MMCGGLDIEHLLETTNFTNWNREDKTNNAGRGKRKTGRYGDEKMRKDVEICSCRERKDDTSNKENRNQKAPERSLSICWGGGGDQVKRRSIPGTNGAYQQTRNRRRQKRMIREDKARRLQNIGKGSLTDFYPFNCLQP